LYLLASLGLALSFGIMRVINMAHGEMLMLGGYLAYLTLLVVPGALGIILALPVAVLGAAAMGGLMQSTVIRRLGAGALDTLLGSWGVSLILQPGARGLFGACGVEVRAPEWLSGGFAIGSLTIPSARLFIIGMAVLVLVGLALLLLKSKVGLL